MPGRERPGPVCSNGRGSGGASARAAAAVDAGAVEAGARLLERAGFAVRIGASVGRQAGYLAGTDEERAAELQALFADRTVRAIIAARGGYGSGRLLPHLDMETLRR